MGMPGVGLGFRETMAGRFSLDVTDSGQCACSAGRLVMHATIHIDDVAAFVADPRHQARLTGHLDIETWGRIPAHYGVFGLFTPSGDPALTYMVYELGFRYDGNNYYLAGKKQVHLGGPWRLWRETTTLYTLLHKGADATGDVVGAGVLRLGVLDLLQLLSTVHAIHASTPRAAISAVWKFFCFFMSELVRTYLRRAPLRTP